MKNRWISVNDRLPLNNNLVLVSSKNWDGARYNNVLEYDNIFNSWINYSGDKYKEVTHWQPLPKPPKK